MKLATFQFQNQQWSCEHFPELDSTNTWVLVFSDPKLPNLAQLTNELVAAYPQSTIIGCTSSGEIFGNEVNDQSLVVSVAQFEKGHFKAHHIDIPSAKDSHQKAIELAKQIETQDLSGLFVRADGLSVNGNQLVAGFEQILPNCPIMGGLAGDSTRFESTQVLVNGQWQSQQLVAIAFYGQAIQLHHASKGGWKRFGPERVITRSEGTQLFELDGQPALALYKQYLGEQANDLPNSALYFPLGIIQDSGDPIVRTILGVDESQQSLNFAGDMPEGNKCQLMRAQFEEIIDGAEEAAETVCQHVPANHTTLLVAISCVGRRIILKEHIDEEVEATLGAMPANTQQIGYYSYGEISPLHTGVCGFHNQTMTLTSITEMV